MISIGEVRAAIEGVKAIQRILEIVHDQAVSHQLNENSEEERKRNAADAADIAAAVARMPKLCASCPYAGSVTKHVGGTEGAAGLPASGSGGSGVGSGCAQGNQPA